MVPMRPLDVSSIVFSEIHLCRDARMHFFLKQLVSQIFSFHHQDLTLLLLKNAKQKES